MSQHRPSEIGCHRRSSQLDQELAVVIDAEKQGPFGVRPLLAVVLLVGLCGATFSAGPLEDGLAAFKRGDFRTAAKIRRPLTEEGNAAAQCALGGLYITGHGVPKDSTQALMCYRKAADQGYASAECEIRTSYYNAGAQMPAYFPKAMTWFHKAAIQRFAPAEAWIGTLYLTGQGVHQNYAQALTWLRKAADQGLAAADVSIGFISYDGIGVPEDYALSLAWFRKAAEKGDSEAQYRVGLMYQYGQGVVKDYVQAHLWYDLAVSHLSAEQDGMRDMAMALRHHIEGEMTPGQIAEARKLASEWKPK